MAIVIDGVIFQMQAGRPHGISRMWRTLLEELAGLPLGRDLLLLDRDGTAPDFAGIRARRIGLFSLRDPAAQTVALEAVCREEGADLFLSTYYSHTHGTPSALMLYDMIIEHLSASPDRSGENLHGRVRQLEALAKKMAIRRAASFMSISNATAEAFRRFYPEEKHKPLEVVPLAAAASFRPRTAEEVAAFRRRCDFKRPYYLLVGQRGGYKNARLFMDGFARLPDSRDFEVVMAGGEADLDPESRRLLGDHAWRIAFFSDSDLACAYSGAVALVYPSLMEGFGLPPLEAMRCGCPVIACRVSSLPEVAGGAALYLERAEPECMRLALEQVRAPERRTDLIARGLLQAGRFSWRESAERFSRAIEAAAGRLEAGGLTASARRSAGAAPISDIDIRVSAIVATYGAERFMRGCLEDLTAQTLFAQGRLEIIVVDSASPEREGEIVQSFQSRHPHIRYLRTQTRETLYQAWNRGLSVARGAYITNANTDDRHRRDALERMAEELDRRPQVALVYADVLKTATPNETFEDCTPIGRFRWFDWDRGRLLSQGCFIGPQPMWRRSVHQTYGGFDERLVTSGDFEFWLRISQTFDFHHIREFLGLYLDRPDSVEHRARDLKNAEDAWIVSQYRQAAAKGEILAVCPDREAPAPATPAPAARDTAAGGLHRLRAELSQIWQRTAEEDLARRYAGEAGELHRRLVFDAGDAAGTLPEDPPEDPFAPGPGPVTGRELLKAMLHAGPLNLPRPVDFRQVPPWLRLDFARYLLGGIGFYHKPGEAAHYCASMESLAVAISVAIRQAPRAAEPRALAELFAAGANYLPLYFAPQNLKTLAEIRGTITDFAIESAHQTLEPYRPTARAGRPARLQLGIHCRCLRPHTETYAALPVFEHLDPREFDVHLFVQAESGDLLEERVRQGCASFTVLPEATRPSVAAIRRRGLDILFFANNIAAGRTPGSVLAHYRMARLQCVHFSNPITTGKRHIDGFLLGRLIGGATDAPRYFTERILPLEGSGICFELPEPETVVGSAEGRDALGLRNAGTVFISGANAFKILPELRRIWARILSEVPQATLVLYPFGPAWAERYPRQALIADLYRLFAARGVAADRLRVLEPLQGRAEILALNRAADIYLDAVPYSGATSLLDPLQAGIPIVAAEGGELRFSQGAAMLRELGCPELITAGSEAYVRLAVRLAVEPGFRQAMAAKVRAKMAAGPDFLNPRRYAARISRVFHDYFAAAIPAAARASSFSHVTIPQEVFP